MTMTTTTSDDANSTVPPLVLRYIYPVVIAGAGPCGLLTALTLQRHKIPFVIYERATRDKVCSNVGSGFDLAPTALSILIDKLNLPVTNVIHSYAGMCFVDMKHGNIIREMGLSQMEVLLTSAGGDGGGIKGKGHATAVNDGDGGVRLDFASVNRADLQNTLLDALKNQEEVLKCGIQVTGYYEEETNAGVVIVKLGNGETVKASALLACDGIHSAVRKQMNHDKKKSGVSGGVAATEVDDKLQYCNVMCWWGKTKIQPGSDLEKSIQYYQRLQKNKSTDYEEKGGGLSFVWMLGSRKYPGSFMGAPTTDTASGGRYFTWAFFQKQPAAPPSLRKTKDDDDHDDDAVDLTIRGGTKLNDKTKQELEDIVKDRCDLLRLVMKETPKSAITKVGLYDRGYKNNTITTKPYTSPGGLVALLGDAAHPQSPFMGQGVNMAITDGYVAATLIAQAIRQEQSTTNHTSTQQPNNNNSIGHVLKTHYDTNERRKGVNHVVKLARSYGDICVSTNPITTWLFSKAAQYMPVQYFMDDMMKGDTTNADFVKSVQ